MVAASRFAGAAVSIATSLQLPSSGFSLPYNATKTSIVYKTVTVCPCTETSNTLATAATTSINPNGPYDNPYDYLPLPFSWPGKPTSGQVIPGPQPTAPFPYGGSAGGAYNAPGWVPKGVNSLVPSLPKGKQNGNSPWGDISCPHLPLTGLPTTVPSGSVVVPTGSASGSVSVPGTNSKSSGLPVSVSVSIPHGASSSGSALPTSVSVSLPYGSNSTTAAPTATPTNSACPTMPDTGVTRTYEFDVAYQTIAPDGVKRNGLTINGQFPGPLVEANYGDWILFKITNALDDEGTTIHCHGLFQSETPWYDGVPAVGQCPITPQGGYQEMLFRADRYGTSWYHSHYSAQYSGGAHGAVVIYGPNHADYDIDIGPIIVEDWFHQDYFTLIEEVMVNNTFPPSNNNLINGKMNYPCANTTLPCTPNAGLSKFQFQSGKKHLLRLINAGAEGTQKFSIDNHTLTVIAQDFVPVEPFDTNVVTLGIGQRTDVIVEAKGKPTDVYWMRSQLGTEHCTLNDGISPNAVAAVYYEDADTNAVPSTTSDVTAAQLAKCKNDDLNTTMPLCPLPVSEPTTTETIDIVAQSNGTAFLWYMNNSSFRGDYNDPVLLKVKNGNTTFEPEWNVLDFGTNTTVRIHLINHGLLGAHPMHLHGHDMQILAEGFGTWDGTVTQSSNPIRRDVHILQNAQDANTPAYMVLQYEANNPGAWPLHCHLAWHVSAGLFVQILENKDEIVKKDFPQDVFDTCTQWDAYTNGNVPDQIDSGL